MIARTQPEMVKAAYKNFNVDDTINRLELERLRGQLLPERSSWFSHWQELGEFIEPRRTRFYTTDVDRGNRRNRAIINSTGTHAAHTLQAGMQSGFTSPARQWFRLTTQDPDLAKMEPVKEWLYDVTWAISDVFLRSNLYSSLLTVYGDMGVFGTGCMLLTEDFSRVIHTYPMVIGSYYLFADDKLRINGFMRDFRLTVRQIIEQFAWDETTNTLDLSNVSSLVAGLWTTGTTQAWIDVTQAIVPNPDWKPGSMLSEKKKYLSVYYERGAVGSQYTISTVDSMKVLSRKGFDKFPVLAPRWSVAGEDIYGSYCPGMEALGDIQGLQSYERRSAQALEKSINPAMTAPMSMRNQKNTVVPGDITFVPLNSVGQKFEPAYQIQPNFQQLGAVVAAIEARIKKSFHEDLFLVISNLDRGNITAEEIRALQNEKLQEIGPVVDRLNPELLDPLVEQTFDLMLKQGRLPPPPAMLARHPLKVEYTSIIAQAQKALAAGSIEQFWGFAMKVQEAKPEDPSVLDPVNTDEMLERYGGDLSVPPGIIRDEDDVAKIRAQRQQAQEAQQKLAAAEQASKTAKNLASSPTDGQNALTDLTQQGQAGNLLPGGPAQ